jgi:hypothetical protein
VGGAGARGGQGQTARGCGHPGVSDLGGIFWEMAKFGGFRGGKGGDEGVGARSTCQTTNPWTKTTKSHKIQQIARKIFGGYFCGDFRIRTKNNKIKLANGG